MKARGSAIETAAEPTRSVPEGPISSSLQEYSWVSTPF